MNVELIGGLRLMVTREAEAWTERFCKYRNIFKGAALGYKILKEQHLLYFCQQD